MKVNAEFDQRVILATEEMPWVPSPLAGVERRMLDRIGEEVARATSLVRYAPGSAFSGHTHGGGEEFLVLSGTFSDEHGDYPAGTYVRNPVGSHHVPYSEAGCVIFVKLWQMDIDDQEYLRINTNEALWQDAGIPGLETMPLYRYGDEIVQMLRWNEDAALPGELSEGGAELLVLSGALRDERGVYPAGSWLRLPAGSGHRLRGEVAGKLWLKRGHLRSVIPGPESG